MNALINSFFLNYCSGMLGEQLNFVHSGYYYHRQMGFMILFLSSTHIYFVNLVYSIKFLHETFVCVSSHFILKYLIMVYFWMRIRDDANRISDE